MDRLVIDRLYEELLKSFADLNQMKQVVNHAFKREFEALEGYGSDDSCEIVSREAFGFDNPFTGQLEKYAFRSTTIEDLKRLTYWHKNSQYCWLLMSAYEKFESYLNSSYFELTEERARTLQSVLLHFSDKYPSIKASEANNAFEINLRVAVHLVEKMRHAIAHNQGAITDLDRFVAKVINDSGIGANRSLHEEFVSQFIQGNQVFILEVPANKYPFLQIYHDQYRILVSYLISYAYLVKKAISESDV